MFEKTKQLLSTIKLAEQDQEEKSQLGYAKDQLSLMKEHFTNLADEPKEWQIETEIRSQLNIINGFSIEAKENILVELIELIEGELASEKERQDRECQVRTPDAEIEWFMRNSYFRK